jgi:hypothetical protein
MTLTAPLLHVYTYAHSLLLTNTYSTEHEETVLESGASQLASYHTPTPLPASLKN